MHNVYEGLSLPVGCGVMIVGLQTRRELNGAHATICAWNSNERYLVDSSQDPNSLNGEAATREGEPHSY